MINYKTAEEIELIKKSSRLVSKTLGELNKRIEPGVIPLDLDKVAETFIRDNKGEPGFLGMYDFPNTLCVFLLTKRLYTEFQEKNHYKTAT